MYSKHQALPIILALNQLLDGLEITTIEDFNKVATTLADWLSKPTITENNTATQIQTLFEHYKALDENNEASIKAVFDERIKAKIQELTTLTAEDKARYFNDKKLQTEKADIKARLKKIKSPLDSFELAFEQAQLKPLLIKVIQQAWKELPIDDPAANAYLASLDYAQVYFAYHHRAAIGSLLFEKIFSLEAFFELNRKIRKTIVTSTELLPDLCEKIDITKDEFYALGSHEKAVIYVLHVENKLTLITEYFLPLEQLKKINDLNKIIKHNPGQLYLMLVANVSEDELNKYLAYPIIRNHAHEFAYLINYEDYDLKGCINLAMSNSKYFRELVRRQQILSNVKISLIDHEVLSTEKQQFILKNKENLEGLKDLKFKLDFLFNLPEATFHLFSGRTASLYYIKRELDKQKIPFTTILSLSYSLQTVILETSRASSVIEQYSFSKEDWCHLDEDLWQRCASYVHFPIRSVPLIYLKPLNTQQRELVFDNFNGVRELFNALQKTQFENMIQSQEAFASIIPRAYRFYRLLASGATWEALIDPPVFNKLIANDYTVLDALTDGSHCSLSALSMQLMPLHQLVCLSIPVLQNLARLSADKFNADINAGINYRLLLNHPQKLAAAIDHPVGIYALLEAGVSFKQLAALPLRMFELMIANGTTFAKLAAKGYPFERLVALGPIKLNTYLENNILYADECGIPVASWPDLELDTVIATLKQLEPQQKLRHLILAVLTIGFKGLDVQLILKLNDCSELLDFMDKLTFAQLYPLDESIVYTIKYHKSIIKRLAAQPDFVWDHFISFLTSAKDTVISNFFAALKEEYSFYVETKKPKLSDSQAIVTIQAYASAHQATQHRSWPGFENVLKKTRLQTPQNEGDISNATHMKCKI